MEMSQFMNGIQSVAAVAAPMALAALWQSAAIALGLTLCLRLAPRATASLRFVVWSVAFTILIALPFLPSFLPSPLHGHESSVPLAATSAAKPWLELDLRWSLAIAGLWLVLSLIRAVDLAIHSLKLRRMWKSAIPVEVRTAARAWGRMTLEICTTRELDRPSVIGFFAPRILIPEWLYERLTDAELNQIVLHETEHLRRCDDWTNLLQKLCLVLFPLNPALWWMERQLCKEREMACDEGVIAITHAPRAYAACLAGLAERGLQRKAEALSLGAWQRRPELVHRVHRILRKGRTLSPFASGALLATVGSSLLGISIEFARCPQFVAFVPAKNVTLAAKQDDDVTDAVYQTEKHTLPTGYRTVDAKAAMPPAQTAVAAVHHASARPSIASAHGVRVHEVPAKFTAAQPEQALEQQWIVFTSWERIETSAPSAAEAADAMQSANSQSQAPVTSRVTVTQLVFKVVPRSMTATLPSSAKSSQSSQPQAVPLRSGWLVLQL